MSVGFVQQAVVAALVHFPERIVPSATNCFHRSHDQAPRLNFQLDILGSTNLLDDQTGQPNNLGVSERYQPDTHV